MKPAGLRALRVLTWIGWLLLVPGCVHEIRGVDLSRAPRLQGIHEGVTRSEILHSLGEPAATYEGGMVAVWFLDDDHVPRSTDDAEVLLHLVVLFDARQVAEKVSLIRVR